jgi:hypothetical protein
MASHSGGPGVRDRSGHAGLVVDKDALGKIFFKNLSFPCQSPQRLLHTRHPSSGPGTILQIIADVLSDLSLAPTQETENRYGSGLSTREQNSRKSMEIFSVVYLWSRGQSSRLHIQRSGFDSRRYQIF